MRNQFIGPMLKPEREKGEYDDAERRLANRNSGTLLETLALDITPLGSHYLLTHFDTPILDFNKHKLNFEGAFENPFELNMSQICDLPEITMPVTLECSGNGRAHLSPRAYSMPWGYEEIGRAHV